MKEINFPNWPEALEQSGLPDRQRKSYRITIGWFLSFCRRGRSPVTHPAARDFIDWARAQKNPQPWQLEGWKEAIRWFFRAGQRCPAKGEAGSAGSAEAPQVPRPAEKPPEPLWKVEFLKVLRRRHYSYRTEQSYLCSGLCRWPTRSWSRCESNCRKRAGSTIKTAGREWPGFGCQKAWPGSIRMRARNGRGFGFGRIITSASIRAAGWNGGTMNWIEATRWRSRRRAWPPG